MPRRLPLFFTLFLLASAATGRDPQFKGLPETGQIDDQRVLSARYGGPAATHAGSAATPQPAAHVGMAGVPRDFKGGFTGVAVDSTADAAQANIPITFGQVFAPGEVKAGERLVGKLADGATLPLQVDVKARHADGSLRHAVISALVPALDAHQTLMLALAKDGAARAATASTSTASPQALLEAGFKACVSATIDGQAWSACADRLLAGKAVRTWLSGPVTHEWEVDAPLTNAQGAAHPHLAARFAVRWFPAAHRARVDVALENDWAYEPGPRNVTYDARVSVGGKDAYVMAGLNHLHHARWRKLFWWGEAPAVTLRHDSRYLIATRALPHYDPAVVVSQAALADIGARWTGKAIEPMGAGLVTPYMPTTGGRADIGLLPAWQVVYLLSMDPRAAHAAIGTAAMAGSWPIHYRDKRTGRPVSLIDYPYMTLLGRDGDTLNPATGKQERFPGCAAEHACDTPYSPDAAHQPNLAYLPYLLSGDRFDLDELQFWATYDALMSNPGYRENVKGLVKSDQVRGQAWALRTIGEAAYITPDNDPLKAYFMGVVKHNLDWYNATYTDNPAANKLGIIVDNAFVYANETGIAPWQDDFFTSAVGHLTDLGFKDASRLLAWKARFPVARMVGPGVCWIDGAIYMLTARTAHAGPIVPTMAEAYKASHKPDFLALPCASGQMAAALQLRPGEMTGYASSAVGYPSNMQPALAYAADVSGAAGKDAWRVFMARSVKPDYSAQPQFDIVPRSVAPASPKAD